jgi:pimeloyl-ACP methyl ester carboxylesterase
VRAGAGAWATLASGVKLHYRIQGHPGAPWLVLINGLLSDTTMWTGTLSGLTRDFRVLTFDSRGQGKSDTPAEGPYPVALLAMEAWELLGILGIERPILAGLSNGSNIALEMLLDHPGACRGAMLTSSVPRIDFSMALRLKHWLHCLMLGGAELQFDAVAPFLWGDAFLEQRYEILKAYHQTKVKTDEPFDGSRHQIEGALQWDIRTRLAGIQDPILLLAGAEDLLTPVWKCAETAKLILHSRFEVIPGIGHAFPVEDPKAYSARLHRFAQAL